MLQLRDRGTERSTAVETFSWEISDMQRLSEALWVVDVDDLM